MKAKYIVGVIIIATFITWGVMSFMSTTIKYVSIDEVGKASGVIQVMGAIDFASVEYDIENTLLKFDINGLEDHTLNTRLKVVYSGVIPGNFEQATSVVVKGMYKDDAFVADQLLVKCPSKYQGEDGEA